MGGVFGLVGWAEACWCVAKEVALLVVVCGEAAASAQGVYECLCLLWCGLYECG